MNEEDIELQEYEKFAERMEKSYPKMFAGKYGGFAVGKGWYPIIERLCASIQQHIEWKNKDKEVCPQVVVEQIKEMSKYIARIPDNKFSYQNEI